MKKQPTVRRWIVAASVAVALTAVAACEHRDVSTAPPPPAAFEKTPDVTEVTSRGESRLYAAGNAFTDVTVKRLLQSGDVARAVERFEAMGMRVAPEDCMVIENVADGKTATATFVAFAPLAADAVESGVLLCVERGEERVLAPATFAPQPARFGSYTRVADGLWIDADPFTGPDTSPEDAQRWSSQQWNQFWGCMLNAAPIPMAACTVSCAFTGPAYGQCVITCVAAQAVTAIIRCAIGVLTSGPSGGNERSGQ